MFFYKSHKNFYTGISIPRLIDPLHVNFTGNSGTQKLLPSRQLFSLSSREGFALPLNIIAGGFISMEKNEDYLPNKGIIFEPSIWMRLNYNGPNYYSNNQLKNGLPLSVNANLRVHFNKRFWLGLGYETSKQLALDFGFSQISIDFLGNEALFRFGLAYISPILSRGINFGPTMEANLALSLPNK